MAIWDFSTTPASNGDVDALTPFLEGQAASSVNDGIRGLMARLRQFADDTGGALSTAGTGNAFTVTTGATLTTLRAGVSVLVRANRSNTGAATLKVDGTATTAWRTMAGGEFASGEIVSGAFYMAIYDAVVPCWKSFSLPDGSVTTAKLADGALSADATGRAKMADSFVNAAKLAADAVTNVKVASNELTATKFADATRGLLVEVRGCTLTTDGVSSVTVASGRAASTLMGMTLASAMTKTLASTWVSGSGNGGLASGSKANSTWYYWYLIGNPTSGAVDVIATTATPATGPAMPTGYTAWTYVGATLTDASGNIQKFYNYDRHFSFSNEDAGILDYTNTSAASGARTMITLSVPNVPVIAYMTAHSYFNAATNFHISSPKWDDQTPNATTGRNTEYQTSGVSRQMSAVIRPTDNRQVGWRYETGSGHQIYIATQGYDDLERGRAN